MIVVGALSGWLFQRRVAGRPGEDAARRLGVLLASGYIVGESLIGVAIAAIVVFTGKATPLGLVGDSFQPIATVLTVVVFAATTFALYRWTGRLARR